jgi:UDP-N-acetylmuramate dehydrogenase
MVEQPIVTPDLPDSEMTEAFGPNLEFSRALGPLTSFGTGGPARYFLPVRSVADLCRAAVTAVRLKIPFFVLGGGSNLLVSDLGYDSLVIQLQIIGLTLVEPNTIEVGAGVQLSALVDFAGEHSLTGLEFAAGIWGSVGGAVFGNAGAFGGEIGRVLTEACLVDENGQIKTVTADYLDFEYRSSKLKTSGEILATARFALSQGDQSEIKARVADILDQRAGRHPSERTAGCFFKNIPDPTQPHGKMPAGRLLEEAGAGSLRVGGAAVYDKHANIIVTGECATSKEIRLLADMMKKKVLDRFGIELQEEIRELGSFQ